MVGHALALLVGKDHVVENDGAVAPLAVDRAVRECPDVGERYRALGCHPLLKLAPLVLIQPADQPFDLGQRASSLPPGSPFALA